LTIYNVYCDESCHLERDHQKAMVLGALWCPMDRSREFSEDIRRLKTKHGLSTKFEIKWTKVSPEREEPVEDAPAKSHRKFGKDKTAQLSLFDQGDEP